MGLAIDFFGAENAVFDKTAFVKFKITSNKTLIKHIPNSKNPMDFKNLKKKSPSHRNYTLGYGFILQKIYSQA